MSEPSCTTCKANRREKVSKKKWPETRKMSDEEIEPKSCKGERLHLKVPLRKVENAIRCWNVYNTKLYDKTSGNCLRRTQISGIYITKGKIRLENACAYGAGSLPRYSTTTFTAIGRN